MMANKGWEDVFNEFYRKAEMTWDQVNHGFIDPDAKERAENEARFEALEARVEALENKEPCDTGEFIDDVERPPADVELRWETSWHSDRNSYYPHTWQFRDGKIYDYSNREVDESYLKEYGFRKRGRWVSEWRDL